LNAYLLHRMSEEERAAFSERWTADPAIYDELQMAEADLLDEYVRDDVSPQQRSLIEEHLLNSEGQLHKLAFAKALQESMPEPNRAAQLRSGFGFRLEKHAMAFVGAGATVVVLAVIGAFLLERDNQTLRREVAVLRQTTSSSSRPMPPASAKAPAESTLYAASLVADDVRGAGDVLQIRLPDRAEILRLELQLDPGDEGDRYSATLSTGGRVAWREEPLVPVRRGLVVVAFVWIPKDVLSSGPYDVALRGSRGNAASYRFMLSIGG
jgi:hypothetical protein